jgi:hypothetical protein
VPASPNGSGAGQFSAEHLRDGSRGNGFHWDYGVLLATVALALEASRRLAMRIRLPQPQFLALLIERPG